MIAVGLMDNYTAREVHKNPLIPNLQVLKARPAVTPNSLNSN